MKMKQHSFGSRFPAPYDDFFRKEGVSGWMNQSESANRV